MLTMPSSAATAMMLISVSLVGNRSGARTVKTTERMTTAASEVRLGTQHQPPRRLAENDPSRRAVRPPASRFGSLGLQRCRQIGPSASAAPACGERSRHSPAADAAGC